MGSYAASTEVDMDVDALIHLVGDFSGDPSEIAVEAVEILTDIGSIDFGYIAPSWMKDPDA